MDVDFGVGPALTGLILSSSTGLPVPGVTIGVGGSTARADAHGRFMIDTAPTAYDLTVVSCDRTRVAVFVGLTRRNPVLAFDGRCDPRADQGQPKGQGQAESGKSGEIRGALSAGLPFPIADPTQIGVYFWSERGFAKVQLGGAHGAGGPEFGPIALRWAGAESLRVQVLALGRTWLGGHEWDAPLAAVGEANLTDGARSSVSLPLSVPPVGRLGGTVHTLDTPNEAVIGIEYQWPLPYAAAPLIFSTVKVAGSTDGAVRFEYEVPVIPALGGRHCITVADSNAQSRTRLCGMPLGATDVRFDIQPAPMFVSPDAEAHVGPETVYRWRPFERGIHRIRFVVPAHSAAPVVDVFTAGTTATWPDLTAFGIAFPQGTEMSCALSGYGPFVSLDVAAGPFGLSAVVPERREAELDSVWVKTAAK